MDAAVKYAEEAFNGPWSTSSAMRRTTCFCKLIELLGDRLGGIPTLNYLMSGNPVSLIPTREKNYIKRCLVCYYGILKNSAIQSWGLLFLHKARLIGQISGEGITFQRMTDS